MRSKHVRRRKSCGCRNGDPGLFSYFILSGDPPCIPLDRQSLVFRFDGEKRRKQFMLHLSAWDTSRSVRSSRDFCDTFGFVYIRSETTHICRNNRRHFQHVCAPHYRHICPSAASQHLYILCVEVRQRMRGIVPAAVSFDSWHEISSANNERMTEMRLLLCVPFCMAWIISSASSPDFLAPTLH